MWIEDLPHFPEVEQAVRRLNGRQGDLAHLASEIQQIPAPTGDETARAEWVRKQFSDLGLSDVDQDSVYNVYARIEGDQRGPALLVSAHTDTVFPHGTDLTLTREPDGSRLAGPGIGDNSTGVAGLIALAQLLARLPAPPVDIWLVANSNEEGLGDLKGMWAAVERLRSRLGAVIVLEGMGVGRIVHQALAVRRYRIGARAPGGHSWGDFGSGSAIHELVHLAHDLTRMTVPGEPRTTYNVGRIEGGRSVNTIAQAAHLELDLRSITEESLTILDQKVQQIFERHRQRHQRARSQIELWIEPIGNRPGGQIAIEHPMVQALERILDRVGIPSRPDVRISSTDANVPLSMGIPAVCIGLTEGGDAHRLSEWIDPRPLVRGTQQLLYLTWWTAAWLTSRPSFEAGRGY